MKIEKTVGGWSFVRFGQAVLPALLCMVVIVFGLFAQPAAIGQLVNADTLMAPHMAWDMSRHGYALVNFQWSRVPSLPDVAMFFAMDFLGVDWRISVILYTCLAAVGMVLIMGWIVARMRSMSYAGAVFWAGIAVLFTLLFAMAALHRSPGDELVWMPQIKTFMVITHGHSFILSLLACCTALKAIAGERRYAWITWAVAAFSTFSDTIFVGYFLLPFAAAGCVVLLHQRRAAAPAKPVFPFGSFLRFLGLTALACLVGWLAKLPLPTAAMKFEFPGFGQSLLLALGDLRQAPISITMVAATLVVAAWAAFTLFGKKPEAAQSVSDLHREWLVLFGLGASVMSLGLALLLYVDSGSLRYAVPFFWWPLLTIIGLLRLPELRTPAAIAAAALSVLGTAALPLSAPVLTHFRAPLEHCLSDHRAEWGLRAGLGDYWQSRLVMASSNWKLQLDQIDENGAAYLWANDFAAYHHDMTAPERPPYYNFVVMDRTFDPFMFESYFGTPAREEDCGGTAVWIYDHQIYPQGMEPGSTHAANAGA